MDQDRGRWDPLLIRRGLARWRAPNRWAARSALTRYKRRWRPAARARRAEDTDWPRIVALYDALVQAMPSPVAELNRAVAVGMASARRPRWTWSTRWRPRARWNYHWLPSVRGDLLAKLGRHAEAREGLRTRRRHDPQRPRTRAAAGPRGADAGRPGLTRACLKCRHAPRSLLPRRTRARHGGVAAHSTIRTTAPSSDGLVTGPAWSCTAPTSSATPSNPTPTTPSGWAPSNPAWSASATVAPITWRRPARC